MGLRGKIFKVVDNSEQLDPTFFISIDGNIKKLEYYDSLFVLLIVKTCSDSIFNLLKRVTDGGFFIFMLNVIFSFSTFLVFGRPN